MVSLTQKETMLLKDLRSHEEWCVKKYTDYSTLAQDPELKTMFTNFAQQERQHYDTVNQILSGQVPSMAQGQQSQKSQSQQPGTSAQPQQWAAQPAGGNQQAQQQMSGAQSQPAQQMSAPKQGQPQPAGTPSSNPFTKSYQQANKGQAAKTAPGAGTQSNLQYEFAKSATPTQPSGSGSQNASRNANVNQRDVDLCYDLLNTEKYVSSTYDTVIFECKDKNVRQALNHIQKEEQEHGEAIFNYLQSKGAYPLQ
jgi:spore coat protein CotF